MAPALLPNWPRPTSIISLRQEREQELAAGRGSNPALRVTRWGKLQAVSIARVDIRAMMGRIEAPILANQVLASTSAVFGWAVQQEVLPANP